MLQRFVLPAFLRPVPLEVVKVSSEEMESLVGVYELDFEPSATSAIQLSGDRLRLLTPDDESVDLVAHSPTFFTGDSRYGSLTVVFETDDSLDVERLVIYGNFARYAFEKREN